MKRARWCGRTSRVVLVVAMLAAPPLFGTRASTQVPPSGGVPRFEVDPFWPKPLPNNWYAGAVSSIAVDSRDHVWIVQRPRTLEANERGLELKNSRCCIPAPPVLEFDPSGALVQAW